MYVNWSYLYRKYLPQSISPFWKITEKTARPNHSLSPKPQIFSTTWCKLHNYFLSWVGAYVRSEAIMQSRAFAKSLIPKWVAVTEPNSSWVPRLQTLSKDICCVYYFACCLQGLTGNFVSRRKLKTDTSKYFKILRHIQFLFHEETNYDINYRELSILVRNSNTVIVMLGGLRCLPE